MSREEILLLFKNEEYDKAVLEIKKALKEDSDNGELFYYLFLAENRDYSNMDINNILSEVNFNKALEYSNRRLKNEIEAEYNFFQACDENFRKLFCYALRGNKDGIFEIIDNINDAKLPDNIDEYLGDLDFIVNSRKERDSFDLTMMVVNLLYILTNENRLVQIYNDGMKNASMFDESYETIYLAKSREELYDNYKILTKENVEYERNLVYDGIYKRAIKAYKKKQYQKAKKLFKSIEDYKDAKQYYKLIIELDKEKKAKAKAKRIARERKDNIIYMAFRIGEPLIHVGLMIAIFVCMFINIIWYIILISIILIFVDAGLLFGKKMAPDDDVFYYFAPWVSALFMLAFLIGMVILLSH